MTRLRVGPGRIALCLAFAAFSGCGGGGGHGGSVGGGTQALPEPGGGATSRAGGGTAQFRVDLAKGTVEATPLGDPGASRAVFTGAAVTFDSQLALNQPGDPGLRVLNVSLTNHWGVPIGASPDGTPSGLRVVFGSFANLTGVPDVRAQARVSTLPGTVGTPFGLAVASDGTVFASSWANLHLMQLNGGTVTTLAGGPGPAYADGLGAAASFAFPCGLALSPADGALYLADYNGPRIRRIDRTGRVTTVAGTGVRGSADGPGNAATFRGLFSVAAAPGGELYATECDSGAVRKLTVSGDPTLPTNWTVTTIATGLKYPGGIAVGGDGMIYVAEAEGNLIRLINPAGGSAVVAGGNPRGSVDGPGSTARFNFPYGLAWTPNGLVISELRNQQLRWVRHLSGALTDPASWQVLTLAGDPAATGAVDGDGSVARFNQPKMLASDGGGAVYVADQGNNAIRKLILPTNVANQSRAPGDPVTLSSPDGLLPNPDGESRPYLDYPIVLLPGDTTPPRPWTLQVPSGVTAFSFSVTVEAATASMAPPQAGSGVGSQQSLVSTVAGLPGTSGNLDGPGPNARLGTLLTVASDGLGDVFVADTNASRIRRIGYDGTVTTIAGAHGSGHDDGAGSAATFMGPRGLAVNRAGTILYVADQGNNTLRRLELPPSGDPRLAADWQVSTIAGSWVEAAGQADGTGDVARFNGPTGLCQVSDTLLFVTEGSGNRVRRVEFTGANPAAATDWQVSLVAGDDSAAAGAAGSNDGTGKVAHFSAPVAIAAALDGSLYVADSNNQLIRRVLPDGSVSTYAGVAGVGVGYVDGDATTARFNQPSGVAVASDGTVYVADANNLRIRRVSRARAVTTVAGTGASPVFDGAGDVAWFAQPTAVTVTPAGTLYVGDAGSVRKIERLVDTSP